MERSFTLDEALAWLRCGEVEVVQRMPQSSNATFLAKVVRGGDVGAAGEGGERGSDGEAGDADEGELAVAAIYKPTQGERPLWDFPSGLHRREIAAYELSDELGWAVIPPTIEKEGPHGVGSVQLFIEADFTQHYFTLVEDEAHHDTLKTICLFDLVANNTDRKSGHCLLAKWGRIYGIDQGLCFAEDFKLRTVIWDFAGDPLTEPMLADLAKVAGMCGEAVVDADDDTDEASAGLLKRLRPWLNEAELEAMSTRASQLAELGHFPEDTTGHRWPWPLI